MNASRPSVASKEGERTPSSARAPLRVPLTAALVATRYAVLTAAVQITARAADYRARGRAALVAHSAADAAAERRAAGRRADGARATFEVLPRGLTVEGVRARAARADGR